MDPIFLILLAIVLAVVVGAVVIERRHGSRALGDDLDGMSGDLREAEPQSHEPVAPPRRRGPIAAPSESAPDEDEDAEASSSVAPPPIAPPAAPESAETSKTRFRDRLARTRNVLSSSVRELFGQGVTDEAWEGLEDTLIAADLGVETSAKLVEAVRTRSKQENITDIDGVIGLVKAELRSILGDADRTLKRADDAEPTVWLVTGVNGTGKTTTIGKLSAREQRGGHSVVLAAADTFRSAAAQQLGLWAERSGAFLVSKDEGSDPASVAYDGYMAAKATDADVVIVDTAGRLNNKTALMDELTKVKTVVEKQAGPLEETLLVLDATTGQNGIAQARAFAEAVDVTGLVLTKLDGSSKGGIVIAVQSELGIPVKLVGLGEDIDDLADFDPDAFVESLFDTSE